MAGKMLSGLLAVHKPRGMTSNDVVGKIKAEINRGRSKKDGRIKVGHGGTLDKDAEGVLVLGIGKGTTMLTRYLQGDKGYACRAVLGCETDTGDATGEVLRTADTGHVTMEMLQAALPSYTGDIMQVPPIYSALKHQGQRLSDLARAGKLTDEAKPDARPVKVYSLRLTSAAGDLPAFSVDIQCGGGFYVRSLVRDLGVDVSSAAHMVHLVRTKQGPFTLGAPHVLESSQWKVEKLQEAVEYWTKRLGAGKETAQQE